MISKTSNYLVNVKFDKVKGNDYFGVMYFANLSSQDLKFMLTEDLFAKDKYKIFIKYKNNIYPLYNDSPASIMLYFSKNEIKLYKVRVNNLPDNFNWNEAAIVVSDDIFNN